MTGLPKQKALLLKNVLPPSEQNFLLRTTLFPYFTYYYTKKQSFVLLNGPMGK